MYLTLRCFDSRLGTTSLFVPTAHFSDETDIPTKTVSYYFFYRLLQPQIPPKKGRKKMVTDLKNCELAVFNAQIVGKNDKSAPEAPLKEGGDLADWENFKSQVKVVSSSNIG